MTPRFPPPLPTPGATPLAARLRSLAAQAPDAPLVSDGDTVLTRAGFDARTNRLARAFADRGVAHGDLVSIALPNTVHHLECSVAAWKLGAVPQPLSARLPAAERDADDRDWEINGVVHSHTHSEPFPSPTDVAQAPDPGWHYVIVSLKRDAPELRSYRIVDGEVTEEPVTLV